MSFYGKQQFVVYLVTLNPSPIMFSKGVLFFYESLLSEAFCFFMFGFLALCFEIDGDCLSLLTYETPLSIVISVTTLTSYEMV